MPTPHRSLAILGFGAFGRFMVPHLRDHFDLRVFDQSSPADAAEALGVTSVPLEIAAASDILVLAVPVQSLPSLLPSIAPAMRPGALVLDVCSVKIEPIQLMQRYLPPDARIVGLHPLFGPQSGKDGIAGLPIALCPARVEPEELGCIQDFLAETLRLHVIHATPDEHDRQMAYVQGLTHFVSRALASLDLPQTPMATRAYERFLAMKSDLHADSLDLFLTIERHNPYARQVRSELVDALASLERQIRPDSKT